VPNAQLLAQNVGQQATARAALFPTITDWTQCAIKPAFKGIFLTPLKEPAKIVLTIAILATYMETV